MTTTSSRTSHARQVVGASQTLMDGLLDAEDTCFTNLDAGLQRVADATRERIIAAARLSGARLLRAELLPEDRWLAGVVLPPISELVAVARERALSVVGRQMQLLAGTLGTAARDAATAGRTAAARDAPDVERIVYLAATDALMNATPPVRAAITEQRRIWQARHEPLDALTARVCSAERVGLPGASRGVCGGCGRRCTPQPAPRAWTPATRCCWRESEAGMTTPTPRRPRLPRLRKQLLAVVDSRTTMVCLDCAGQIREADEPFETLMGSFAAPPFHLHCRSIVAPYTPDMINEQRDAANAEIRARPRSEKRKGPHGYEGPLPPPAPASAAVQVLRPRPDTLPPAAGARLPGAHRQLTDWTPLLARLVRVARDRATPGTDPVLAAIAEEQRFAARPRVVSAGQLTRLIHQTGAVEVWRGVTGPDAATLAEELRTGAYMPTLGIYGAGLQFTTSRSTAARYAAGGVLVRATLVAEARTITWAELEELMKTIADQLSPARRRRFEILFTDPGRFAAALGYDAVVLPNGELLVLNRTALVMTR